MFGQLLLGAGQLLVVATLYLIHVLFKSEKSGDSSDSCWQLNLNYYDQIKLNMRSLLHSTE